MRFQFKNHGPINDHDAFSQWILALMGLSSGSVMICAYARMYWRMSMYS